MEIEKYIQRINYKGELSIHCDCLRAIHRCHVMSIPFESIDIHLKKKISLDLSSIYDKVVMMGRGGFCYELNYLFHSLLTELGFNSKMVSSRIFDNGSFGPNFDHMSLVVTLEEDWLVDVGYGDLFIEPLKIYTDKTQQDHFKNYKIEKLSNNELLLLESLKLNHEYKKRYVFELSQRNIDEFSDQCFFKQSSPDSYFVKNKICTQPTIIGRKTILNDTFKLKTNNQVEERKIKDNDELLKILKAEFSMSISNT